MKKINAIVIIVIAIIIGIFVAGCGDVTVASAESTTAISCMENVLDSGAYTYVRDIATDVIYIKYKGGYAGGLTVMLDPVTDLPLTYERFAEYCNSNKSK